MAFGLTPAAIAEFAARPFVARSLANPSSPASVLSFFLGIDFESPSAPTKLQEGAFLLEEGDMTKFWFAGGPEYDKLCQAFKPVLQDGIGKKSLPKDPWDVTVDGQMAQLVLCDQLSRNIFRGSDDAFAYDDVSLGIARNLVDSKITSQTGDLQGEFYPPYATLIVTALMHSEELADHQQSLEVLKWARHSTQSALDQWWDNQLVFELDHKRVIDQFGRYPHRNAKKGRESTPEEEAWLANVDELPGWAKSQM